MGAGEVVGVDLRHHPPNICKTAILSLKVRMADPVVLWWKALQDYVLLPAVRGALLGCDGIQAVAASVLLVEKNHRDLHLTAFSPFPFPGAPLARPRASSDRTSRVELPMRPVYALLRSLVFSLQPSHDRESWAGCRKEEDAEQIIICTIPTLASGHLIVVQAR